MSTSELKNRIVALINAQEDPDILSEVHALLSSESNPEQQDWWETLPNEVKEGIQAAQSQYNSGEVLSHESVRAEIKKEFGF